MATLVKFRYNELNNDLFAFFPQLFYYGRKSGYPEIKTGYSQNGQHSPCHEDYCRESRPATESEYQNLKTELLQIGYKLKICR